MNGVGDLVRVVGGRARRLQTGNVQIYALAMLIGAVFVVALRGRRLRGAAMPILSCLIIFTPILGALVIGLLPGEPLQVPRRAAFALSLIPFGLALIMLAMFQPGVGDLQLTEKVSWIPSLGVNYSLGVDGFSLWLVVLTTLLTPSIILAAWGDIERAASSS